MTASQPGSVTVRGRTRPVENGGMTLVEAPTLEALGGTIRHEIDLAQKAATRALEHAIIAGEALCEAKLRIPKGKWVRWLEDQGVVRSTAETYMRIADFRDVLVGQGVTTVNQAKEILRDSGLKATVSFDGTLTYEIKKLVDQGMSRTNVAKKFGVSRKTVERRLADPEIGTRQVGGHNRRKPITDHMIEGMAVWLAKRERRPLNDMLRGEATDALRVALNYSGVVSLEDFVSVEED